tara:strand:- start:563 stop:835 length:273 start_codon:yes stop_codon:yes gene_type:complete
MPRYRYECGNCGETVVVYHGINDVIQDCEICKSEGTMNKVFSTPISIRYKKDRIESQQRVGELTKKYIEDNKGVLKDLQEEARKKDYEPT